jgi:hypothetical protein
MEVLLLDGFCVSHKDFNIPRDMLDEAHKHSSPLSSNSQGSEECLKQAKECQNNSETILLLANFRDTLF